MRLTHPPIHLGRQMGGWPSRVCLGGRCSEGLALNGAGAWGRHFPRLLCLVWQSQFLHSNLSIHADEWQSCMVIGPATCLLLSCNICQQVLLNMLITRRRRCIKSSKHGRHHVLRC